MRTSQYGIHIPKDFSIAQKVLPKFDLNAVLREDSLKKSASFPYRFGIDLDVDIDILELGTKIIHKDTTLIFFKISSKGALSINLIFDKFCLGSNTSLMMYDSDYTMLYGPVTSNENPSNGVFWSGIINGESIIIEVSQVGKLTDSTELHISKVIHGYKKIYTGLEKYESCHLNIACSAGETWRNDGNAVALVIFGQANSGCSGSLINNTSQNLIPYFLTSFHCLDYDENMALSSSEMNAVQNWKFQFKFESQDCVGETDPSYIEYNGATFRAGYQPSDFALLELDDRPNGGQGIAYAGWSRVSTPASLGVGIHHPALHVKKISVGDNQLYNVAIETVWLIDSEDNPVITCPPNTHWDVLFDEGTVEPGSSGSPVFDQNHRIVGQLHGDALSGNDNYCSNKRGQYGRFDVSWIGDGNNNATRLSHWLDPGNTSYTSTNTIQIPYITGSEYVCQATYSEFSIINPQQSCTITWSTNPVPVNDDDFIVTSTQNGCRISNTSHIGTVVLTATTSGSCGPIDSIQIELTTNPTYSTFYASLTTDEETDWLQECNGLFTYTYPGMYSGEILIWDPPYVPYLESVTWTKISQSNCTFADFGASNNGKSLFLNLKPLGCNTVLRMTASNNCGYFNKDFTFFAGMDCGNKSQFAKATSQFLIYPNPTIGVFTVKDKSTDEKPGIKEIVIRNFMGMEIMRTKYNEPEVITIDISNEVAGIYFLEVYDGIVWTNHQISLQR